MNVIVLGLGVMGTAAAMHLSRRGARVLGVEQYSIGHELGSSHGETRLIRKAYFESPAYVPLLQRSYELWRELEKKTGQELLFETGLVMFAPGSRAKLDAARATAAMHGIDVEVLDERQATARFSGFDASGCAALYESTGGWLAVERCVAAHARVARELGADLHESERVLSWSATTDGVAVTTDRQTYLADHLVITAGPWAPDVLAGAQLPLAVHRVTQHWFAAQSSWRSSPCFAFDLPEGFFYGFPSLDGATIKLALHAPGARCTPADVSRELSAEDARKPEAFVERWLKGVEPHALRGKTCMYTMTPDEHFIVDRHPAHANVHFGAGFSGHGFKFAPVIGECLAELAIDGQSRHPIHFLRSR